MSGLIRRDDALDLLVELCDADMDIADAIGAILVIPCTGTCATCAEECAGRCFYLERGLDSVCSGIKAHITPDHYCSAWRAKI